MSELLEHTRDIYVINYVHTEKVKEKVALPENCFCPSFQRKQIVLTPTPRVHFRAAVEYNTPGSDWESL